MERCLNNSFLVEGWYRRGQAHHKKTYRVYWPGPMRAQKDWNTNQIACRGWTWASHTLVANVQLGLQVGPPTIGAEAVCDCCLPLDLLPGLPDGVLVGEEELGLAGTGCSRVGWYPADDLLWGQREQWWRWICGGWAGLGRREEQQLQCHMNKK